jgi:hypothetical protein
MKLDKTTVYARILISKTKVTDDEGLSEYYGLKLRYVKVCELTDIIFIRDTLSEFIEEEQFILESRKK